MGEALLTAEKADEIPENPVVEPESPAELPSELVHSIVQRALGRRCRVLSSSLCSYNDAVERHLALTKGTPEATIRRLCEKSPGLVELSLRGSTAVAHDRLLSWLLEHLPALESIDVSGCTQLTSASTALLETASAKRGLRFASVGNWRMHGPSPSLSPVECVALQVYALRDNSDAGLAACFALASPENKAVTGPVQRFALMIRAAYRVMLCSQSAKRTPAAPTSLDSDGTPSAVAMLVAFEVMGFEGAGSAVFRWELSRQPDGCWMTDGVMPAEPAGTALEWGRFVDL